MAVQGVVGEGVAYREAWGRGRQLGGIWVPESGSSLCSQSLPLSSQGPSSPGLQSNRQTLQQREAPGLT